MAASARPSTRWVTKRPGASLAASSAGAIASASRPRASSPNAELDPGQHVVREQLDLLAVLVERLGRALLGQRQAAAVVQVALAGMLLDQRLEPRQGLLGVAREVRAVRLPRPDGRARGPPRVSSPAGADAAAGRDRTTRSSSGDGGWNWRISRSGSMARSNSPSASAAAPGGTARRGPAPPARGRPSARARARCSTGAGVGAEAELAQAPQRPGGRHLRLDRGQPRERRRGTRRSGPARRRSSRAPRGPRPSADAPRAPAGRAPRPRPAAPPRARPRPASRPRCRRRPPARGPPGRRPPPPRRRPAATRR